MPGWNINAALGLACLLLAMGAIAVMDTLTHYEVAVAVFYTLVILAASTRLQRRGMIGLAAACLALTVGSFLLTESGAHQVGLVNGAISMVAISATTWLALRMAHARAAAHKAQAQLLRLARVRSLESLTTSIAHEVNQPLAAIVTSANASQRWLAQHPAQVEKAGQALERILQDADRASAIVARVRDLTRGAAPARERFDVNATVREVLTLSHGALQDAGIRVTTDLAPGQPHALADRVQIQQVLGNLLLNALQAMTASAPSARHLHIHSRTDADTLVLSITDSGPGFPESMRECLFDAFWTTKTDGIGIGLSISRTLIEANGGSIQAENVSQGGARFSLTLPLARETP